MLRLRSDVRFRVVDQEAVVVRQSAAEVLVLNEVGASVLDLADGERPVGEWIATLAARYDADPATLAAEVLEFAGELREAGLLETVVKDGEP